MSINKTYKFGSIALWVIFLVICIYYLIHNAFWLGGDEVIVMNATGWGHAFVPPREPFSIGRFFPLSYNLYNILLLFPHGKQIDPIIIYVLQSIGLCVFSFFIGLLCLQISNNIQEKWRHPISLLAVIFAVSRVYPEFVTCYTGVWIVFTLLPVFLWCAWRFSETNNTTYAVIALVVVNYIIYCYETVFTVPLAIGAAALLFNYRILSKKERWFYSSLVCSTVLFLILYVVLVVPKTVKAYDGAHGQDVTFLTNAIHIFVAQKTLWVVVILFVLRTYDCIKHRKRPCFFDYFVLASCAYCCGATALKLNYIYYYNAAVIVAIPSIVYFGIHYLKPGGALILLLLFAGFYGTKMPKTISNNQTDRESYRNNTKLVVDYVNKGAKVYWYSPYNPEMNEYDLGLRDWRQVDTEGILGWALSDEDYHMEICEKCSGEPGLWFIVELDEPLFLENVNDGEIIFECGGLNRLKCYRIEGQAGSVAQDVMGKGSHDIFSEKCFSERKIKNKRPQGTKAIGDGPLSTCSLDLMRKVSVLVLFRG